MIITLDGPCGSGKSTLAQLLAGKLGFFYINSGYLYRSLAYILVTDFDYNQEQLKDPLLQDIQAVFNDNNLQYFYKDGLAQVHFKGNDITQHLKNSLVSDYASLISADVKVRQAIVAFQQKFGMQYDLVTDGRDGGTEIYPQAEYKFYVVASDEIRAQRLQADSVKNGENISFDDALRMTLMRDERDMTRLISPLKKADDAIEIDTSFQSIQQTLDYMLVLIQK